MKIDVMINNGDTYYGTLRIKTVGGGLRTPFESATARLERELLTRFPTLKGRNDIVLID